ncbi:hypothetical protein LTR64_006732 [Lithohypha guttulata]|uniref:uncharacterized protein n=1 Tax=Lithohypha guttulata TaxID=1690604 RepID=UPI002DDE5604|nr:hypothetical protein LTR51_004708 [Lithohypha guttulata]
MMKTVVSAAGLVAAVSAFTQPVQPPTYGSLLRPDSNTPVTTGQTYEITWTPTPSTPDGTVSLVLCNGPSSNCVLQSSAIIERVPASAGKYSWNVPCTLAEGVQSTASGYGMLVIEDGTGRFQYSTQFSVQKGASCSSSSSSSSTTTTASPTSTASYTHAASGWLEWNSTSSVSTLSTSTTSAVPITTTTTTTSARTTSAAPVTTSSSVSYTTISVLSSSAAASTSVSASTSVTASTPITASTSVTARPSTFTGAAALPTAFVNVAGLVGAGLAVLAL